MHRHILVSGLLAAALTVGARADRHHSRDCTDGDGHPEFLTVGDPAPAIDAAHWLKGEEIDRLEEDRVYAIVFWATWCKYCRAALPDLSRLQTEHEADDVRIVGVSGEKLQTVFAFLAQPEWNAKASFSIAADPDRSVHREYMEAAAVGEIPVVFVVGRTGEIEWIGHPRDLEAPLKRVVAGEWDRDAFRREFEEEIAPARRRFQRMRVMKKAYLDHDWDELLRLFDNAIDDAEDPRRLQVQKFMLMIGEMDRPAEGYAFGRRMLDDIWNEPKLLNDLAWFIVDHESVEFRDLGFAMKTARRACELTEFRKARLLDTLARVHFELGRVDEAIRWQEKAVERLDEGDPLADSIRAALKRYRSRAESDDDRCP